MISATNGWDRVRKLPGICSSIRVFHMSSRDPSTYTTFRSFANGVSKELHQK